MKNQKGISTLGIVITIIVIAILAVGAYLAYKYFTDKSQIREQNIQANNWQGTFYLTGAGDDYGQIATLEKVDSSTVKLTVIGPEVRPNAPTCQFIGKGNINSNIVTINLDNSQYNQKDAKVILKLSANSNQLDINTNTPEDNTALMRFCYGGGSIGGIYIRK